MKRRWLIKEWFFKWRWWLIIGGILIIASIPTTIMTVNYITLKNTLTTNHFKINNIETYNLTINKGDKTYILKNEMESKYKCDKINELVQDKKIIEWTKNDNGNLEIKGLENGDAYLYFETWNNKEINQITLKITVI